MDQFKDYPATLTSPATSAVPVVPHDTNVLPNVSRAIYVGQTGDLVAELQDGHIITFTNVQAGSMLPIRALKIQQTGTTAAAIVALW